MSIKFLYCPQCGIRRFYIKNSRGQRLVIQVSQNYEYIPVNEGESIDGFELETLYCLGCSWSGPKERLSKTPRW
ncbi:MAG TPA: hypothetical protein PK990_04125 [Salinivirgaceae bacterium]|nr:hypothetical protein [Salinivirgaceae bacterium]